LQVHQAGCMGGSRVEKTKQRIETDKAETEATGIVSCERAPGDPLPRRNVKVGGKMLRAHHKEARRAGDPKGPWGGIPE